MKRRRLPILAACRHVRIKSSRNTAPQAKDWAHTCSFGNCRNKSSGLGVVIHGVDPFVFPRTRHRPGTFAPMCASCFKFAQWHVHTKWKVFRMLKAISEDTGPIGNVPRGVWTLIESHTWTK